jgi:hypothetical protein
MEGNLEFFGELRADHIRDTVVIGSRISPAQRPNGIAFEQFKSSSLYDRILRSISGTLGGKRPLRDNNGDFLNRQLGLVTTTGVNYLAAAFGAGPSINLFNFHASGTGKPSQGTQTLSGGSISNATPQIVTTPGAHGLTTNDLVTIIGVTTDTTAVGDWQIAVLSSTTFQLQNLAAGGVAGVGTATYNRLNGAGDTILVTENDNGSGGTTRIAGTQTQPGTVNIYKSVATLSYTGSIAVSEWGLFSAVGGGTLWDRRWFNTAGAPAVTQMASGVALAAAPINVINGDSIAFTYNLTCNAGGS